MFDQDPPFLKIFAGVGKVTVVTKEVGMGGRPHRPSRFLWLWYWLLLLLPLLGEPNGCVLPP